MNWLTFFDIENILSERIRSNINKSWADINDHISSVEYRVKTVTSAQKYADSGSIFYYTITGARGKTAEYRADNPEKDRQLGQTNTYTIHDNTDIGEFRCVSVRLVGHDGWVFTEVKIYYVLMYMNKGSLEL